MLSQNIRPHPTSHIFVKGCGQFYSFTIYFPEHWGVEGAAPYDAFIHIPVFGAAICVDCFQYIAIFHHNPADCG